MAKAKTITLTDGWTVEKNAVGTQWMTHNRGPDFRVEKITDSVEYATGQMLTKEQVETLCAADDWRVTIVPYTPKQ